MDRDQTFTGNVLEVGGNVESLPNQRLVYRRFNRGRWWLIASGLMVP